MRGRGFVLAVSMLVAGLGASCTPGPIRILSPSGVALTWMPVTLHLDLGAGANQATFLVTLNGVDVTSEFVITPAANGRFDAIAEDVWAPGLVLVGTNTIHAEVENGQGQLFAGNATFETEGDPYADAVPYFAPGAGAGFGQASMPGVVLGPPRGGSVTTGTFDVVSLGTGDAHTAPGVIQLEFVDNVIIDGPGPDFTVFENAFFVTSGLTIVTVFSEPGRVSVSQDGVAWCTFSACQLDLADAPDHPGCAGVMPTSADADDPLAPHASIPTDADVTDFFGESLLTLDFPGSGGNSFDLADLAGCTLDHVRFVEIEAAEFNNGPVGPDNRGFDLDAVAAIHSAPPLP